MKTLRIYGDSFAAGELGSWTTILSELLGIPIVNNAISGSSTEYSVFTFVNDVNEGIIDDKDIIVFVPSSTGRLYFSHQLYSSPSSASTYNNTNYWYRKNKNHVDWWIVNNNTKMQSITFESYIQLLKNFALSKPLSIMVVLQAFNNGYSRDIFNNVPPHNFLRPEIYSGDVSKFETDQHTFSYFKYDDWVEFIKHDPRSNHLTIPNLNILANLLYTAIKNLNADNITYDKFKTNIINKITSKDQYLQYVNDGILTYRPDIENNLK
jgi:hypothetical protein